MIAVCEMWKATVANRKTNYDKIKFELVFKINLEIIGFYLIDRFTNFSKLAKHQADGQFCSLTNFGDLFLNIKIIRSDFFVISRIYQNDFIRATL